MTAGLPCSANPIDLSVKPGLFGEETADADKGRVDSGLGIALQTPLLNLDLGYDFRVYLREDTGTTTEDDTSQHIGASLRSRLLDDMLGLETRVVADSKFLPGDGYDHRIRPAISRVLLDLATLDLGYQYQLKRTSAAAPERQQHAYSFGLRGELPRGRLDWSGNYVAADEYNDQVVRTDSTETLELQSGYRIVPAVKLQLSGTVRERTRFNGDIAGDSLAETLYGAGVTWAPSPHYALGFKVDHREREATGEEAILRSGTISWQPSNGLAFSLDYGDQLVEGSPGLMFNTRLDLDSLR
jgi:hypothetical protein